MTAGFVGGGGSWYMEVLRPKNQSDFWLARWEVWNQEAPEQRIWRVTYGRVSKGATTTFGPPDVHSATSRLVQALREIHVFSAKHDCGGFTQCFAEALDTLIRQGPISTGITRTWHPLATFHRKRGPFWMLVRRHGSSVGWGHGMTWALTSQSRRNTSGFRSSCSAISTTR
jgi:hypothetical protein